MLRESLDRILDEFMAARAAGDEAFAGHPLGHFVRSDARNAVLSAAKISSQNPETLFAKGSVGDVNRWTQTPWIGVMDRRETDSIQEGVYVVYLFSADCQDLYLTINQGCTTLYQAQTKNKEAASKAELQRRAQVMRSRLPKLNRLKEETIELRGSVWRSRLYEAGTVCAVRYSAGKLPSEQELVADLSEAMIAYDALIRSGTWSADDDLISDAEDAGRPNSVQEAKIYRQHRKIERSGKAVKQVKALLGTTCMGCQIVMGKVYGPVAEGYIEAHHLKPLSSYDDGEKITLDPSKDFAVLCANCHRVIHRMEDTSDIQALRDLLAMMRANAAG